MEASRPLDALNMARGKRVIIETKNGKQYVGKLNAFDIHINVVLTDTEENLSVLLAELGRREVRKIAASYLFLRPAFAVRLAEQVHLLTGSACSSASWSWGRLADGVGGGQMVDSETRRCGFERLRVLADNHGIELHVCACKNPDQASAPGCLIAGPAQSSQPSREIPLFPE